MEQNTAETRQDFGEDPAGLVKRWLTELKLAEKQDKKWIERAEKVVKRYRDEREESDNSKKLNILWSNIETLKPACYFRTPKPVVSRRYKDADPVGRQASQILERALSYHLDAYDFDTLIKQAVEDFLLPGRGVSRVVYKPSYTPITGPDGQPMADENGQPLQEVAYEEARCEYVFWKDIRFGSARFWAEVPWVAIRSFMNREQLRERFGELGDKVSLDYKPDGIKDDDGPADTFKKAQVWEIWSKTDGKVYWIAPGMKDSPLDVKDPPLKLKDFFNIPKPLQALSTNDKLTPIPEYTEYQDQADELDTLTGRIKILTDALRLAGVYDASHKGLERLLSEGADNQLIPVDNWAVSGQQGLENAIAWFPVEQIAKVILALYEARERTKQELYEITGLADIIRGASNPNETATAQQIKDKFASLRLQDKQKEVARFARDLIRLKAEVIAENFSPQTLQLMTGLEVNDQVMQVLRTDPLRSFRIDIETDSTIQLDEQEDKQSRVEFVEATSTFLERAMPVAQAQPAMMPLLGELLMFAVRGFRAGRELEETFEQTLEQLKQQAAQPQPPRPDPNMVKAEAQAKQIETKTQLDVVKTQSELQHDKLKMGLEVEKAKTAAIAAKAKPDA